MCRQANSEQQTAIENGIDVNSENGDDRSETAACRCRWGSCVGVSLRRAGRVALGAVV